MTGRSSRSVFVRNIYDSLITSFFKKQKEKKLIIMSELARKNQIIRGGEACFLFEGEWYTYPHGLCYSRKWLQQNRTLDISLRDQAHRIMHDQDFDDLVIQERITNLFGSILQKSRTVQDLNALLPTELGVSAHLYDLYDRGLPMTKDELTAFREKHRKAFTAINTIYLTELLLAKVEANQT